MIGVQFREYSHSGFVFVFGRDILLDFSLHVCYFIVFCVCITDSNYTFSAIPHRPFLGEGESGNSKYRTCVSTLLSPYVLSDVHNSWRRDQDAERRLITGPCILFPI